MIFCVVSIFNANWPIETLDTFRKERYEGLQTCVLNDVTGAEDKILFLNDFKISLQYVLAACNFSTKKISKIQNKQRRNVLMW